MLESRKRFTSTHRKRGPLQGERPAFGASGATVAAIICRKPVLELTRLVTAWQPPSNKLSGKRAMLSDWPRMNTRRNNGAIRRAFTRGRAPVVPAPRTQLTLAGAHRRIGPVTRRDTTAAATPPDSPLAAIHCESALCEAPVRSESGRPTFGDPIMPAGLE